MSTRWKAILSIGIIIFALAGTLLFLKLRLQRHHQDQAIADKKEIVEAVLDYARQQSFERYGKRIKSFLNPKVQSKREILQAFAARDSELLRQKVMPFLKILHKENSYFSKICFVLPDTTHFLVLHASPFKEGTAHSASHRHSPKQSLLATEANNTQKSVAGYEVTHHGLDYRVIEPVFYEGQYLGLVTFNVQLGYLLEVLTKQVGPGSSLAVKTSKLQEVFFPPAMDNYGPYQFFPPNNPFSRKLPLGFDSGHKELRIKLNDRFYTMITDLELKDFKGEPIARIILPLDITEEVKEFWSSTLYSIVATLVLFLVAMLVLYFSFGTLLQKIVNLNEALEESNENLEATVQERTKELRHAHEFNETVIDAMFDSLAIIDVNNLTIQRVNRTFLERMGMTKEEVVGKLCYEVMHNRSTPCSAPDDPCPLHATVAEGKTVIYEHMHHPKDGHILYEEVGTAPLLDKDGNVVQALHVSRDITERKMLQGQLIQSQKMEAVGRLSGGIAHDFNNILTSILGYSELALFSTADDNPLKEKFKTIYGAGLRAADLTRQLLAFSRKQVMQMKAVNLNNIIENLSKMLRRMIGESIELTCHVDKPVANILADPSQIEQILMNLAVNAKDAMPQGGSLFIETGMIDLDEEYTKKHDELEAGPHVLLTVADTGTGMSKETQAQIFEPFFTSKELGKGTGLGLATIYGIVTQHKGHIYVYSELDAGTTFKIYFPVSSLDLEKETVEDQPEVVSRGTETILAADDDPHIRSLIVDSLEPLGYTVVEASSGEEALKIIEKMSGKIDLLLTDVVMGGITGLELSEKMSPRWPTIKVLFMSGYPNEIIAQQGILETGMQFIPKPLLPSSLSKSVREILDEEH